MKSLHTGRFRRLISLKEGETLSWRIIKGSLIFIWLIIVTFILKSYSGPTGAVGICTILPCGLLSVPLIENLVLIGALICTLMYFFEIRMALTTALIFFLSVLVFTFEESNGVYNRTAAFSAVFMAQALAYNFSSFPAVARTQYSRQIIAAVYTLSGLSKLINSGIGWFVNGNYVLLQVQKEAYFTFFDSGNVSHLQNREALIDFFSADPALIQIALAGVLLTELCAGLMLISRKMSVIYGVLLLLMHIAIGWFMGIIIFAIALPMVVILLNPVYRIVQLVRWISIRTRRRRVTDT